jgi:hypothetical protein
MAKVVSISQAYAALVNRALATLPAALAARAATKRGVDSYTSPVNELALYIRGPYAEQLLRKGYKYAANMANDLIGEMLEVPNSELPDYAEMLDASVRIDNKAHTLNDIGYAAILNILLTKRSNLRKLLAKPASSTAETWWTLAPPPFDGFSTIRTGEFDDIPAALNVPPVRYYEVKIEPRDVEWQTHRYSSGGFASMNEIGRQEQLNYLDGRRVSESAEDAIRKEWPKLIEKMQTFNVVYNNGGKAWLLARTDPADIIAGYAYAEKFKDAISPMIAQIKGYSFYNDLLNRLIDTLRSELPNAESRVKQQGKQAEIDEHNQRVYEQAYSDAMSWIYTNGLGTVTPYFSKQVRVIEHGHPATRGPYYAALPYASVVFDESTDTLYPAIGELPIFGEYPHADYFVDATNAILTSPHEHDADAVEWMRKNMLLFANGRTTEVIVMPRAKAYVAKTENRKSTGFMAMTGRDAHTSLSGAAKAAATRAMGSGKAVTFSFSPRGIDRPTYPPEFAERIGRTHAVPNDWKGHATKWKLAK